MSGHETRKGGNGQTRAEARRESNCPRHKTRGRKIGICRHAPSNYPEFAQLLVEQGIDSISLNPDAVLKTPVKILDMEQAEQFFSALIISDRGKQPFPPPPLISQPSTGHFSDFWPAIDRRPYSVDRESW